jgi:uncharacterized protein (TIGR02271 family)
MEDRLTVNRLAALKGEPVYDANGDKIGKVEEIYYDYETRIPEWLGIGTGLFGSKRVLVPVKGAREQDDGIAVAYAKDQIKDSPDIDTDEISEQTERELAGYYGLGYSEARSSTGLTEGAPATGTPGAARGRGTAGEGETVTRSEEELKVGKRPVEAGRVRLRKWVETEPVEMDVELEQQRARVTREQVDQPVGEHEFGEEEVEVPLRGEEPVVQKETRAKERVAVGKETETERESVSDEVRKERIAVEGDNVTEDRR